MYDTLYWEGDFIATDKRFLGWFVGVVLVEASLDQGHLVLVGVASG